MMISGDPFSSAPFIPIRPVAPYTGLVASKCGYVSTFSGTNKQVQSRSYHVAADNISSLKIAVSNWYMSIVDGGIGITTTEVASGGNCVVTASIEYPLGQYAMITFSSGSASLTLTSGATGFSDMCSPVSPIPRGATFGIGQYRVYSGNGLYNPFRNSGDTCRVAASGLPDVTMGGTLTDDGVNGCPPLAVIASTRVRSVILSGDSIMAGRFRNTSAADWRQGLIATSFPAEFPFINLGLGGEAAANAISNSPGRSQIWPFCSHFVSNYYWNDIITYDHSAATIESDLATIYATLPAGTKKLQCTAAPYTDSTDSWVTTINQSTHFSSAESRRTSFNTSVRALGITGQTGYLETSFAAESSNGSGLWKVDGTSFKYVSDGLHPTVFGYGAVSTAAIGDLSIFNYP